MRKNKKKTKIEKSMITLSGIIIVFVFVSLFFIKARLSSVNIEVERLKKEVTKQEKKKR